MFFLLKKMYINLLLFIITILTTLLAGTFQAGGNPFTHPSDITKGIPFSFTLLAILLVHELGHYFYAKKHNVNVSLPYFIPGPALPPPFFSIGTFGAFIKMKSRVKSRNAIFDIGVSGPILSFVGSCIAMAIGLKFSQISYEEIKVGVSFGEPLIIKILSRLVLGVDSDKVTIFLHPIGFAAWLGFFVTFINLLPVGQLDGGHAFYAIFGKKHKIMSKLFVGALIIFGIVWWPGWLFWAVLLIIFGLKHPPIMEEEKELSASRKIIAIFMLLIFILVFMYNPFQVS